MKTTKKIVALIIAMMIVSAMAVSAFALTITVNRDSSYSSGSGVGNVYKVYKVFDASYEGSGTTTGGGSGSYWYKSGTSNNMTVTHSSASYTATQAQAAILMGSGTGNQWFTLTPISGTNTYNVSWSNPNTDFDTIQAAAQWLIDSGVATYVKDMTADVANGKWTATGLDAGYYIIQGGAGANLIAATTDINIDEKNTYPSLDKTQTDDLTPSGTTGNGPVNVKVGDKIKYEVKVSVPTTVKVGDVIGVWDKATNGLTYNTGSMVVTPDVATEATIKADQDWGYKIEITSDNIASLAGKDVIFAFTMTVNESAVIDIGKENESGLEYGHGSGTYFESIPDKVEYRTYFSSLLKIDGNTEKPLDGVEFQLQDGNGNPVFLVQSGTYYYPGSGTGSGTAKTNASGTIYFRGLDSDLATYKVLEISNPHPGYNMLSGTVALTLKLDTITTIDESGTTTITSSFEDYKDENGDPRKVIENNKGTVLPSTGGMGTTILYIAGAILVLGAGILLVTKRRANY